MDQPGQHNVVKRNVVAARFFLTNRSGAHQKRVDRNKGYAHLYPFNMSLHEFGDFRRQFLLRDVLPVPLAVRRQNLVIGLSKAPIAYNP